MSLGRVASSLTSVAAVVGCVVLAISMSRAGTQPDASGTATPSPSASSSASDAPSSGAADPTSPAAVAGSASASSTTNAAKSTASRASSTPSAQRSAASHPAAVPMPWHPPLTNPPLTNPPPTNPAPTHPPSSTPPPGPVRGGGLPLGYSTGNASRVVTVTSSWQGSTTATLQAWQAAPGGGWLRYGPSVTAHIGADGMTGSPSESLSATPMGSFTLTQAFGVYSNPGTGLPYFQTTPADWWISQSGPLYNTHQRCAANCPFNQGAPNEHLLYETPYYDYAVVIDYNTANAGPIRQGAGSAFFLHVTDGTPTAGCVAIPMSNLVTIMRWLNPATHPRILIGTA